MRSRAFRCGHDVRKRQRRAAELCRGGKLVNKAAEGGDLIAAARASREPSGQSGSEFSYCIHQTGALVFVAASAHENARRFI